MSLLIIFVLISLHFKQKYFLNNGVGYGVESNILLCDSDRDSRLDLIFGYHIPYDGDRVVIYELYPGDTFHLELIVDTMTNIAWSIGDFDLDGLFDLILSGDFGVPMIGIQIFESPDSFSYPTLEVWRDTVMGGGMSGFVCPYDIDRDGMWEMIKLFGDTSNFDIYECTGDNSYSKVFSTPIDSIDAPHSLPAFGDFDGDGKIEFVFGGCRRLCKPDTAYYWCYESPANNTYELVHLDSINTEGIIDCFSVPDADGDGKMEFVLKGFTILTHPFYTIQTKIFEATGDNSYEIIDSFSFHYNSYDYWGGLSDVGDIDGDGNCEIVLEGCDKVYVIKSNGNNSFYFWDTLPGHITGSNIKVFDIDGNGLNEIVISGNNETRIYEKTPDVIWFCPVQYDTFWANDTVYPRWRLDETIALDSLRLYWAHPILGCHLIYQGLPQDTICQWVVPDTQSNMGNRLWLVVEGNGRYDSTYSPVFYIRRAPGIEETGRQGDLETGRLEVYPNPFTNHCIIKFQIPNPNDQTNSKSQITIKIYNSAGQLVRQFNHLTNYQSPILWDGDDDSGHKLPAGVYFVQVTDGKKSFAIEKVIKLE
ncbi:MAG: T9SS type A sorting domain-containing protein [candidate division WOR-3 bacterium]